MYEAGLQTFFGRGPRLLVQTPDFRDGQLHSGRQGRQLPRGNRRLRNSHVLIDG
jgi:hypothetical protein